MESVDENRERALVSVNGEVSDSLIKSMESFDGYTVVAVDGGLRHLRKLELDPDYLIGDLDSAGSDGIDRLKLHKTCIVKFPAEKDATDLELALNHLGKLGIKRATLIGISGGRLDHTLANLVLLGATDWPYSLRFLCDEGVGYLVTPVYPFAENIQPDTVLSLIPIVQMAAGVTTAGLYYPLNNASIPMGSTLGISNLVTQKAVRVSVQSGKLMVIINTRENSN